MISPAADDEKTPFQRFEEFARKIVAVTKEEAKEPPKRDA